MPGKEVAATKWATAKAWAVAIGAIPASIGDYFLAHVSALIGVYFILVVTYIIYVFFSSETEKPTKYFNAVTCFVAAVLAVTIFPNNIGA